MCRGQGGEGCGWGNIAISVDFTIIGAIVASVLSFQLLIESAILHERARMRRLIKGLIDDEDAKADDA